MAIAGVRNVLIRFQGEKKSLDQTAQGAGKQIDTWRDKMRKFNRVAVGASLAVGAGLVALGKDSLQLSRDLSDLDAKSKAVFEDQLGPMRRWAEQNKAAFGSSRDQVVGLAANMADLLKPMGFTAEQAAAMSREMLDLSGALAKWSGGTHDAAAVSEILTKAMLGERDQLKALGISISEADVQQRLAKKGQEDLTGAALQQAKALATQELILEKSTDAQTAWAEGGRAAAEAENAHAVTMQELREKLARGLTPAFEAGTKMVQSFAKWAEKNTTLVKILAGVIVGLAAGVLLVNAAVKVWRATVAVATAVQWAWNAAMAANPIGLIILAIAALIAIIILVIKNWDTVKRVFFQVWNAIWDWLKKFGKWIATVFWENGIKRYFQLIGAIVGWVRDRFVAGFGKARDIAGNVIDFVTGIPGRIRDAFARVAEFLSAPFRAGFNAVRRFWNNTIGGKGFDIPSWVPFGIGGKSFRFPKFHSGGIVPGPLGREVPILARAGEEVVPADQRGSRRENHFHIQAWTDRFSWPQVERELDMHGVT